MTDPRIQGPSRLPSAPEEYDPEFMARLIGLIDQYSSQVNARHKMLGTTMNLSMLPTSATGLRAGDVWNNAGYLSIVGAEEPAPIPDGCFLILETCEE